MKTTIELAAELKAGNVKKIFNAIDGGFESKSKFEYSELADTILEMVARYANGFVTDIAKRFRYNGELGGRIMSDKQRWCVAFAFQKLTDDNFADYTAYCQTC